MAESISETNSQKINFKYFQHVTTERINIIFIRTSYIKSFLFIFTANCMISTDWLILNRGGSRISRWGGGRQPSLEGRQPPTQALFGEKICKNERIWSCWGGGCTPETFVCRSATAKARTLT